MDFLEDIYEYVDQLPEVLKARLQQLQDLISKEEFSNDNVRGKMSQFLAKCQSGEYHGKVFDQHYQDVKVLQKKATEMAETRERLSEQVLKEFQDYYERFDDKFLALKIAVDRQNPGITETLENAFAEQIDDLPTTSIGQVLCNMIHDMTDLERDNTKKENHIKPKGPVPKVSKSNNNCPKTQNQKSIEKKKKPKKSKNRIADTNVRRRSCTTHHTHNRIATSNPRRRVRQKQDEKIVEEANNNDETLYCFCRDVSYGDMIACDHRKCPYEWFHYDCVGLTESPIGKWYCSACKRQRSRK